MKPNHSPFWRRHDSSRLSRISFACKQEGFQNTETMIALSHHELRYAVRGRQEQHRHHPAHGCRRNLGATFLDSTELSAAHALLTLMPSSTMQPMFQAPRFGADEFASPYVSLPRPEYGTCYSRIKPLPRVLPALVVTSDSATSDESSDEEASQYSDCDPHFFTGSVSLALDTDEDFLSPLHCFMRRYCVEAFTATEDDVVEPRCGGSHNGRVIVGQVGIRCLHCKHRPPSQRTERAVCFPSSLKNIYHSIETWQRRHSLVCNDIPTWVKQTMTNLIQSSRSGAGGRRGYWEESAIRVGLANTSSGIRFIRTPGDLGSVQDDRSLASVVSPSSPVVEPNDRFLVTDYLFLLLDQMETCKFTEEDRAGGRSKIKSCPVGFPGMQCKHCAGKAGFGRYFPTTLSALTSANSDRNIFNHIQKCRRCPQDVKEDLVHLRSEYQRCKNRRGSRKVFFERVWERLHSNE